MFYTETLKISTLKYVPNFEHFEVSSIKSFEKTKIEVQKTLGMSGCIKTRINFLKCLLLF